jgi:hypothetical protein
MSLKSIEFVPLFVIWLILYWVLAKMGVFPAKLNYVVSHVSLPSGIMWKPTWGDLLVLLGVFTLYFELAKSTRTSETSIVDHLLSTFVLIGYLIALLTQAWAGNSVFMILTSMSFLDVIAGFTITISAARYDVSLGGKS